MASGKTTTKATAKTTAGRGRGPAVPDRASVGARLRDMRKASRLTLKELSVRSGVALSTLSKMELGQVSASYEKLAAVARALAVDVGQLFGVAEMPPAADGPIAVRSTLADAPRYDTDNYDLRMLATVFPGKRMTPAWGRIEARRIDEFPDYVRHAGQEFVMVLAGSVKIAFETGKSVRLRRHETAYFDSGVGHVYLSTGRGPAEIIVVMSPG
jgi:transcriptional regulator with XRE-family HTH domain